MVNPSQHPTGGGETSGTPRWVKVFAVIAFMVLLLLVILMFTRGPGGRRHGPGLHTPSGSSGGQTRPSVVAGDYLSLGVARG